MNYRLIQFVVGILMVSSMVPSMAQSEEDLVKYLNAGQRDASKLTEAYISPIIEGLSYTMSGGWYTTAKVHKTLGFDLGVSLNTVFIPTSRNYFDANSLGLEATSLVTPSSGKVPTIIGPKDATSFQSNIDLDGDGDTDQVLTFAGPEGLDFKNVFKFSGMAAPTATLGIGIIKGTDLRIRFMPEVNIGSSSVKLYGVGVMHDIKQHMPGVKLLPFDLSVIASYQQITGLTDLSGEFNSPTGAAAAQEITYSMSSWLAQVLISKKIAIVTFYGGVGYNGINTKANITGSYVVKDNNNPLPDLVLEDPVNLKINSSSFRVTAGVRLNFGPIYFVTDYSYQTFNNLSVGLGVTVR